MVIAIIKKSDPSISSLLSSGRQAFLKNRIFSSAKLKILFVGKLAQVNKYGA
jgi:hypothetical protein